jgi:hypothetical protein
MQFRQDIKLPGAQRPRPMHFFQKRRYIHVFLLFNLLEPG